MAVIYLKHERHGTKVACTEQEAVADEANGWARYSLTKAEPEPVAPTPDPAPAVVPAVAVIPPSPDAPAKRAYTRRQ